MPGAFLGGLSYFFQEVGDRFAVELGEHAELGGVDPALSGFALGNEGLWPLEIRGHFGLGEPGLVSCRTQSSEHSAIFKSVNGLRLRSQNVGPEG